MCVFIGRYMDIFMLVFLISFVGRRRCFWEESGVLGFFRSFFGFLGEGNGIMEGIRIFGFNF